MSIIKPTTVEELKEIFFETLMNNTDSVTKIAPLSVTNGIAYAVSKVGQKVLKEAALIETHLFPDLAWGNYLDNVADNNGVSPRFGASGSNVAIRVVGDEGTQYIAGTHTFKGSNGVQFEITNNFTIPEDGFMYIIARSVDVGEKTNIPALSINSVTPTPNGHKYCINEFKAVNGRDYESDEDFRKRIKESTNVLSRGTLAMLEQVFLMTNSNVLRCYFNGFNKNGNAIISVLTQNGIDLSQQEIDELLLKGNQYFSLTEFKPNGSSYKGIEIKNVDWYYIDISARVKLHDNVESSDVLQLMQENFALYFDYRQFSKTTVQWIDLIDIVKDTVGVKYVLDNYFYPNQDIKIPYNKVPRMRGFLLLNPDGSQIINSSNNLNPYFYPKNLDFNYQKTVYKSLLQ